MTHVILLPMCEVLKENCQLWFKNQHAVKLHPIVHRTSETFLSAHAATFHERSTLILHTKSFSPI